MQNDIGSAASASHLDKFVDDSGACLWVHGHMHISRDYFIGKTHILCNPRGYTDEPNPDFKADLVIEI